MRLIFTQLEKSYSTFSKSFRGEKKARKPWKTKLYTRKSFLVTQIQVTMKKIVISTVCVTFSRSQTLFQLLENFAADLDMSYLKQTLNQWSIFHCQNNFKQYLGGFFVIFWLFTKIFWLLSKIKFVYLLKKYCQPFFNSPFLQKSEQISSIKLLLLHWTDDFAKLFPVSLKLTFSVLLASINKNSVYAKACMA